MLELLWIALSECYFFLSYMSGRNAFPQKLTPEQERDCLDRMLRGDEDALIVADDGTIIRTNVSGISVLGRATQGVRIMRPNAGARVISAALTEPEEDGETEFSTEGQDNVENSAENVEE